MRLEAIVSKYLIPQGVWSTEPVRDALWADLADNKRFYSRLHLIYLGLVVAVVVLAITALAFDLASGQAARTLVLATAGLSLPALLELMRRANRDCGQIILIMTLVAHSDEKGIQALLKKLIEARL